MKRLGNHVGPFTHNVVTGLVNEQKSSLRMHADEAFLIAKQIVTDLPVVPTGERVYDLTMSIQSGLLDSICALEDVHKGDNWQKCLNIAKEYLKEIGVFMITEQEEKSYEYTPYTKIPQC